MCHPSYLSARHINVRPQLAIGNISRLSLHKLKILSLGKHLEIVLAQTQDLEFGQTSRDCAEHLEIGLHKLKISSYDVLILYLSNSL